MAAADAAVMVAVPAGLAMGPATVVRVTAVVAVAVASCPASLAVCLVLPPVVGGLALLYLLGMPLALGSYWGLLPFVAVIPLLIRRLIDEEKMLTRELEGYRQYRSRVRYRLVPRVW